MFDSFAFAIVAFLFCALVIFFAGRKLSYYGSQIAEITGMGRAWTGLILLSLVTTLPELVSGISASAIVQSADLAVGNVIGSCAFNLSILVLMDWIVPKNKPLLGHASQSHILAAAIGIVMITSVGIGIYFPGEIEITHWIGLTSISFLLMYLLAMRIIFLYNRHQQSSAAQNDKQEETILISKKKAFTGYAVYAILIIAAALFLPQFANRIAEETGLGKSFVGTLFLALSTSLPEIAISISAVRMGATDLSIGNILGSNIFNIVILFIDDLFYIKGHLLKDVSEIQMISIFSVIAMSATAIIGLIYKAGTKRFVIAWDTMIIFLIYILNLILLFFYAN
ncbi:MAG: sodium:calcium antiporter [Candidatus Competibacteraceae bacterium]|nr:sodium:calcium antiporter [Candidatus Competibacteraceae bacterium]